MIGPDAARYLHLARGGSVPRPFHLRRLLPWMCGTDLRRWWVVWGFSWPLLAVSAFAWQSAHGWQVAAATAALLVALPGILGPAAVIPVGVDLPTSALTLAGVAMWPHSPLVALALWLLAAGCKETAPLFAALWLWSPWPLAALAAPAVIALARKPGPDPLGARFQQIADHPIRASMEHHLGRWRDGWLMVAPWGACLLAAHAPTWQMAATLIAGYALLLVATDTVRLYQHAAAPVMAAATAQVIPVQWLLLACVLHAAWWRTPERV